jgi:hypothetical protein
MKNVLYTGPPATFGEAGYFEPGTQKEVEDTVAVQLLGKQWFTEVAPVVEAPVKTKAVPSTPAE